MRKTTILKSLEDKLVKLPFNSYTFPHLFTSVSDILIMRLGINGARIIGNLEDYINEDLQKYCSFRAGISDGRIFCRVLE